MSYADAVKVARIVRDAGGRVVGRTRLQKLAYLLSVAGHEGRFSFTYRHYGPYSEELALAVRDANLLSFINETEQVAAWGGTYSTYTLGKEPAQLSSSPRRPLASAAAEADAVELELAATAVFLALAGVRGPWEETARRKPEKAEGGRLQKAQALYGRLRTIDQKLPAI